MSADQATIVIADDDPLVRSVCEAVLARQGYGVVLAEDGALALALVEEREVDFVLLDMQMPGQDGLKTLVELKRRFPLLRVFAMSGGTAHGKGDSLSLAAEAGADAILRKPFPPQALIDLIAERAAEARQPRS